MALKVSDLNFNANMVLNLKILVSILTLNKALSLQIPVSFLTLNMALKSKILALWTVYAAYSYLNQKKDTYKIN